MSREGGPWSCLGLARISEVKWTGLIHTRRGWEVQMRVSGYLWVEMDEVRTQDVTVSQISNIGCKNEQRPIVANNRHKLEGKY